MCEDKRTQVQTTGTRGAHSECFGFDVIVWADFNFSECDSFPLGGPMFANRFIQPLISILTKRGRQTRALARKFDLELTEAFSLVRSAGSPELAEQKLQSQRDEQKKLSSLLWNSPNRY